MTVLQMGRCKRQNLGHQLNEVGWNFFRAGIVCLVFAVAILLVSLFPVVFGLGAYVPEVLGHNWLWGLALFVVGVLLLVAGSRIGAVAASPWALLSRH